MGAFNVNNMEQIQAIMTAATETNSPVIVQASRGARSYSNDNYLRHLMLAAVEARRVTGRADFARMADEIATYIERDLTSPDGAFYSAEDADSEGEEGRFYLWTEAELTRVLGETDAELAEDVDTGLVGETHTRREQSLLAADEIHRLVPVHADAMAEAM